jgi:hypothetical protein
MKKIITVGLVTLFQAVAYSQFVTVNLDAELLKTSGGSAMPQSGLVILVTSIGDAIFGGPSDTSFVTGNDAIVKAWDLTVGGGGGGFGNGIFAGTTGLKALADISGWAPGDPLEMYWFPTLTLSSPTPGAGTSYGQYRDATGVDGSAIWNTPSGSSTIALKFFTSDATFLKPGPGSNPVSAGNAGLTTVPEPSEYAMVFAMFCFAGALIKRGFKARTARL